MSLSALCSVDRRVFFFTTSLAILLCSLFFSFRVKQLDRRPMHGDEANQAVRTGALLEQGVYHYDPADHHGPVLYYAALPFCRFSTRVFSETTEFNFRMVPVCFSILTLLLLLGLYRQDGKGLFTRPLGALIAIVLVAVSPAMNYYSRFFIQETMLVTFLTGMLVCAVRYVGHESPRVKMAYATGLGCSLGLALATKETVVLSLAAAGVAMICTCGFRQIRDGWCWRDALIVLGVAALIALLFYSSFLTYPKGAYDAVFATVGTYFKRATAVPEHHHPWTYYLKLLFGWQYGRGPVWREVGALRMSLILLAVSFPLFRLGLAKRRPQQETMPLPVHVKWTLFVAIYTGVLTLLYSFIPYKTPWCILTFLEGFLLLAAMGFDAAFDGLQRLKQSAWGVKLIGMLALYGCIGFLAQSSLTRSAQACFKFAADIRNPYVYAHTGNDALMMVETIEQAARLKKGQGMYESAIAIAAPPSDYWPLPWYLRKYTNVGYWTVVSDIPAGYTPDILIVSADQGDQAGRLLGKDAQSNFFGIRPGRLLLVFVAP